MSEQEVSAPQANLSEAPLSGLLQGFQFGAALANQRDQASEAADARAQQQQNFQAQLDLQRQGQTNDQQYRQQLMQQASDHFDKTFAQNASQFDAQQQERMRQGFLGQVQGYMGMGFGYHEAELRATHDFQNALPGHPLNGPSVQIDGLPIHSMLTSSDPANPANGTQPEGTPPIGKFFGPNGEHFSDTPITAGQGARAVSPISLNTPQQEPLANVAARLNGEGAPSSMPSMAPPQQQPAQPAQEVPAPQGQPQQGQQPPITPEQIGNVLRPILGALTQGQPSQAGGGMPAMGPSGQPQGQPNVLPPGMGPGGGPGGISPMGAMIPNAAAPMPTAANTALLQQSQQGATQLLQQSPDLPGRPDPDASPKALADWAIGNQAFHASIQQAQDTHDGAVAENALRQATMLETQARTKQMNIDIQNGDHTRSLQDGLIQSQIDTANAKRMLDRDDFNHRVAQDAIDTGIRRTEANARLLLARQARDGQLGADSYADVQKDYTANYAHLQAAQKYVEQTQTALGHTQNVMKMDGSAFDVLKPKVQKDGATLNPALQPGDKGYDETVKLQREWDTLQKPVPNPAYNAGAPQHMAQAGIPPTIKYGDVLTQTYQNHLANANQFLDRTTKGLDHQGKILDTLRGGDPNAAKNMLGVPSPNAPATATVPPAKAGAKGVAPVTPPAGVKRSTPAPQKTTTKPTGTKPINANTSGTGFNTIVPGG